MTPSADIVRKLIISSGLGTENADWTVFTGFLPDETDNAIACYDTAGVKDGRLMRDGLVVMHPGVQVRVRGGDYPATLKRAQEVAEMLDGAFKVTVDIAPDQYRVDSISRTGDVNAMGEEMQGDRRRFNFTVNAVLTVRKI